jgi:signal peptidase II
VKRFLASATILLALDQATKWMAHRHLAGTPGTELAGNLVRLQYVQNTGAAFSLFQGSWALFVGISAGAAVLLVYLAVSRHFRFWGSMVALGLILGGALGNLIDRLWLRRVIDFIDVGIGAHRWPTFNVADIGVTLGVLHLAIGFLFLEGRARPPAPASPSNAGGASAGPDHG